MKYQHLRGSQQEYLQLIDIMRLTLYYISATLIVLFYASCNSHRSSKHNEKDIIAELDGEVIYANEINTIIKQICTSFAL